MFSQNEKSPQKGRKYLQMSDQQGINLQNMQQLMKLNIKKKTNIPNQKISGRYKYTFLQRKHTGSREEHEKTLNITNY